MILGIYGAGGLGREVFELARIINDKKNKWSEILFIDDKKEIDNPRGLRHFTSKNISASIKNTEIEVVIAVGEPSLRKNIYKSLINNKMNLATLIHPDNYIPKSTSIGEGTIICNFSSITCDINIGKNVYIHPNTCIGHDSAVGDHSVISSYVDIAGNCSIGECSFLAINVCMRQNISIGYNTIVGMASVVHRNIPDNIIAMGNPARALKKNIDNKVFK